MTALAEKIIEYGRQYFGYGGKLIHQPNPEADYLVDNPNRRCPDIGKAREQLGYNPTILVDDGLRRAVNWYHHNREAEDA